MQIFMSDIKDKIKRRVYLWAELSGTGRVFRFVGALLSGNGEFSGLYRPCCLVQAEFFGL